MSDRDGGKPTIQIVIFGMGRYWVYHMRYVGGVYLFLGMAGETKKILVHQRTCVEIRRTTTESSGSNSNFAWWVPKIYHLSIPIWHLFQVG